MMTTSSTSPIAAVPHPTASTVQILCVAADRREAELVRDELVKIAQDFNVDASCTLQDAIARVEDPLRYDAVLFDVHLQSGDTLSQLTQLGELDGGPAVIMMGDEERCRTAFPAADAYLVKDQDYLARLPVVVQEVLSRRRPESRAEPLAQAQGQGEAALRDSQARREAWAKEWPKERDELTQALQAAESVVSRQAPAGTGAASNTSESRVGLVLETEPVCVTEMTGDGLLVAMNAAGLALVGAERLEQVLGGGFRRFVLSEDQQPFEELIQRVCAGGKDSLEYTLVRLDGSHRRVEILAVPLRRGPNEDLAVLAVTLDSTELKSHGREVRESAAVARWQRLAQEWGAERERLETVLRDSEAQHEAQAKEWRKERDQLTEALRVAESRTEPLAQAQGQGGTADSEAQHEVQAKEWAKEQDQLTEALQAAESRAERLAQEWNAERRTLVASLRSAESRHEKSEQERARDRRRLLRGAVGAR